MYYCIITPLKCSLIILLLTPSDVLLLSSLSQAYYPIINLLHMPYNPIINSCRLIILLLISAKYPINNLLRYILTLFIQFMNQLLTP